MRNLKLKPVDDGIKEKEKQTFSIMKKTFTPVFFHLWSRWAEGIELELRALFSKLYDSLFSLKLHPSAQ